jgi:hypothetical protein
MSDYLSNLAARSLEAVPAIRPRLASFYEAPQRGFALPPEPVAETGEETNDVVAIPAQPRERRPAPASKPPVVTADPLDIDVDDGIQRRSARITAAVISDAAIAAPAVPPNLPLPVNGVSAPPALTSPSSPPIADSAVGETRPEQGRRREVPAVADEGTVTTERTPASATHVELAQAERIAVHAAAPEKQHEVRLPQTESEPPPATARNRQRPRAQPESRSRSLRPNQDQAPAIDDTEPARAVSVSPREHPGSPRERVANPEPSLLERVPPTIAAMNRITPSRIVAESQPALRLQPVPRLSPIHPRSSSAPDVHITIGRVEVRAVAAAEPPARARSAAPSGLMNLDDYLRRRDGKGRR